MIDVATQSTRLISLQEAAEILGKSYPTVTRYVTHGYAGHKLDVVKVGRSRRTTRRAIQDFLRRMNGEPSQAEMDEETQQTLARHGIQV